MLTSGERAGLEQMLVQAKARVDKMHQQVMETWTNKQIAKHNLTRAWEERYGDLRTSPDSFAAWKKRQTDIGPRMPEFPELMSACILAYHRHQCAKYRLGDENKVLRDIQHRLEAN